MSEQSKEEFMIEAVGLSKYYGDFIAVEDLNISIRKGEVVAFLGPHGAGKSTTMKMLTGYLAPSMTPIALLNFFGDARSMDPATKRERISQVIDQCALQTVLSKPIGKLSRGFRQRVGMANVLLHEPDVLIMDEPTAGLDPNQVLEVRKTIKGLGKTILLSTHILQEVPEVADRVLLINNGRLIFEGTPDEIKSESSLDTWFNKQTLAA